MKKSYCYTGQFCKIRTVTVDDAEFTMTIRNNPKISGKLPAVDSTLENQVAWIERELQDETDYFFVVCDLNDERIGTTGVYNIKDGIAESGRLAIIGNPLQAIEAQYLMGMFMFEELNISELRNYIFSSNKGAIRNVEVFGGKVISESVNEDGIPITNIIIEKDDFLNSKPRIERMIYRKKPGSNT